MILNVKKFLKQTYCYLIWSIAKTKKKRIVFESFGGSSYSDNPKAISEALHKLAPDLEIVWLCTGKDLKGLPDYVKKIKNTFARYKAMASAQVIVNNVSFGNIPKRKDQHYIQTWHGDRAFKKVLYDSSWYDKVHSEPVYDEYLTDFCVAGSKYGEQQYRSAFNYKGEVLLCGTPRDDVLLHVTDKLIHEKKKIIGLKDEYKYLLYAPTLRRSVSGTEKKQPIQNIDIEITLRAFQQKYGGEWKCLLRAHPGIVGLSGKKVNSSFTIDVTRYPDMADLLVVSDALITDYSSSAGDFALLKRPMFLFQDDIDEYQKKDRTFYFDLSKSPYLIAHSQKELERLIKDTSLERVADNCEEILKFYGTHETGKAANFVAKRIIEYCKG